MTRGIWKYELLGVPLIVTVGSMLHFAYAWSGEWAPMALVAPVNESVWEHLKMVFWPGLAWAVLESRQIKRGAWPFWTAKAYGLLVAPLCVVALFYAYTALLGRSVLALDIAIFVIAIGLAQTVSAVLLARKILTPLWQCLGMAALVMQLLAFMTFTHYPPQLELFVDSRTGTSGIPAVDGASRRGDALPNAGKHRGLHGRVHLQDAR